MICSVLSSRARTPVVGTTKCPESLCLMLALPPSGRRVPSPPRTLLPGLRSYGLIRQSRVALLYFGLLASFEKSLQVATSPCCYRDSPDVISANPSSDAWSRTPAGPTECIYLFLPLCHRPSPCRNWVGFLLCSANTTFRGMFFEVADISLCSGLRVCSPPRSFPPLCSSHRAAEAFTFGLNVLRCLRTHRIC